MQPRTLESIISELGTIYNPQINSLKQQQSLIPQSIADEEKGLQAKQGQAFDSILGGARQRGLGFSGIPLQEQAKYTSTEYLPALARLRTQGRQQAMSLEDAINGVRERQQGQALGVQQYEQQRYDQNQQYERSLAEQQRQAAASLAASRAQSSGLAGLFGGGQTQGRSVQQNIPQQASGIAPTKFTPAAEQDVLGRVQQLTANKIKPADLISDYIETRLSAANGNQLDQAKLVSYGAVLSQFLPQWYGNQTIANDIAQRFGKVDSTRRAIVESLGKNFSSMGTVATPASAVGLTGRY